MRAFAAIWIVGWTATGALGSIAIVGKPRQPLSPAVAVGTVIVSSLHILAVWVLL